MGSGILSEAHAAALLRALEQAGEASQVAAVRVQAVEFATQALRSPMDNGIPLAAAAVANPQADPPRRVLRDVPLRVLRRFPACGPAVLWQDAPALASVIPGLGRVRLSPLPRGSALEVRSAIAA
jgi:hypothetical protein